MSVPDSVRFRAPRGRIVVLLIACLLIGAMGVVIVLLNLDNLVSLLVGAAAIGLFGLGGGFSLVRQLRATTLRADADGLHVGRVGTAPWGDVDRIGTTARGELGVRLRRSDALLSDAPRDTNRETLRETRATSGYDLVFSAHDLGTTPSEAAAALRRFLP
ncbi:hypothetical protein [Microbacterium sp. SORGH_AS_0888]|uniref:hypothetical protein n=1 Tax=Microbacterium sp. SORGH_AS_0888 TaxID=3041791 RepID=UPI002781F198|nr:hypothetical protein [Microbacterium sp. SORGH_AS_0888]MDQ1128841.1 hypothetical protein [Microbacterium sp. SORGH_AS_0888]